MKTISLKNVKDGLSRDEMRAVKGGCFGSSGRCKCCWSGTNNCSECSDWCTSCTSGAVLRYC